MSRPEDFLMDDEPEDWNSNNLSSDPPNGTSSPFLPTDEHIKLMKN